MCCHSRSSCNIVLLLLGCALLSVMVSLPMFVLTYPGDECLLFISVRGEALIYGNPVGCNFIAYGHCVVFLGCKYQGYLSSKIILKTLNDRTQLAWNNSSGKVRVA